MGYRVIKVGAAGLVSGIDVNGFVVTAGHCLLNCRPYHAASYTDERTYGRFSVRSTGTRLCAPNAFSRINRRYAVLGTPARSELYDEAPSLRKR